MPIVYFATNSLNGQIAYVGKSRRSDLSGRRSEHERCAKRGDRDYIFYRALRKYGIENFSWGILSRHKTNAEALAAEIEWIAKLKPRYNMTAGGEGTLGRKHSPATRAKIAAKAQGRPCSEETREKHRISSTGRRKSPEELVRMSIRGRGRRLSDDAKSKISVANKGRRFPPEVRAKVSAAGRGRKQSPQTIAKRTAKVLGQKRSKMSATIAQTPGWGKWSAKLKEEDVAQIRTMIAAGISDREIAAQFQKTGPDAIRNIRTGRTWKGAGHVVSAQSPSVC
jgi:group I intron endonuclease